MRGWPSSGTRRARSGAPTISRRSRRSVSGARRCPSIASVSHFVLRTRAARAAERHRDSRQRRRGRVGRRGRRRGRHGRRGRRPVLQPAGAPQVSEVRRRPNPTQVSRIVTQLALAYPEIGFTLTSGGRTRAAVSAGRVAARSAVSAVRRAAGSARGAKGGRRAARDAATSRRSPSRARRAARSTCSSTAASSRTGRSRTRSSMPTASASIKERSPEVHLFIEMPPRRGRRQRPSDEGGSQVPRPVARARGRAARADGHARTGRRAAAAAAAGGSRCSRRSRRRFPAFSRAASIRAAGSPGAARSAAAEPGAASGRVGPLRRPERRRASVGRGAWPLDPADPAAPSAR